jgi:hypothetical protein
MRHSKSVPVLSVVELNDPALCRAYLDDDSEHLNFERAIRPGPSAFEFRPCLSPHPKGRIEILFAEMNCRFLTPCLSSKDYVDPLLLP